MAPAREFPAMILSVLSFSSSYAASFTPLGDLSGGAFCSGALSVSADGSTVVGYGTSASGREAFRWTQATGMVGLGDLPGGDFASSATDVSADGSVVVGSGTSSSTGTEAFRWTQAGGMVGLGDLPGGDFASVAVDVSADGSVVVGHGTSQFGREAVRWTANDGMVGLGDLPGGAFHSHGAGVSADGSIVVGLGTTANGEEAMIWTQTHGMQRVLDVLVAQGVTGLTGWTLTAANSVSADGRIVVGQGINPLGQREAFVATVAPQVVPVPAAVWLFGGAIGALAAMRRATRCHTS